MKCEICHLKDAETALRVMRDGVEDELYVCRACAAKERTARQKKSQRTRKSNGLPPNLSISVSGVSSDGEAPPPFLAAIMNAVSGIFDDIEEKSKKNGKKIDWKELPLDGLAESPYCIRGALQLEGLHLLGELEPVRRAARALDLDLVGVTADGVKDAGHCFRLLYAAGGENRARRLVGRIRDQERNARARLFAEMPRVIGDALCRALAVLKNCRLLAPGELFDLLSPLRLGALEDMLDGITSAEIEAEMSGLDLNSEEDRMEDAERDRIDAERADEANRRYEDVVLNETAEGRFL